MAKKILKKFKNHSTESEKTCENKCNRRRKERVWSEQALSRASKLKEWEETWNGVQNLVRISSMSICERRRALKTFKP